MLICVSKTDEAVANLTHVVSTLPEVRFIG